MRSGSVSAGMLSSLLRHDHLGLARLPTRFRIAHNTLTKATMSVFNSSRLLGKTVVVTGASAGIGAVSHSEHMLSTEIDLMTVGYRCTFRQGS
jgi:hypothetical protein